MAVNHIVRQYYSSFRGLNLSTNDITRDPSEATEAENARIRDDGSIVKRNGYKYRNTAGSYGLISFPKTNPTTGEITEELVLLDSIVSKQMSGTITISNAVGTGQPLSVSVIGDSDTNSFIISLTYADLIDNNGDVSIPGSTTTISLGDVTTTASLKTIAEVVTDITAVSGLSASASSGSDTSVPGASINLEESLQISDGSTGELTFYYESAITADSAATLTLGRAAYRQSDDGELPSHTVFNRSLYITNGYDDLLQYDGHTLFKAGMVKHDTPSAALGAAGSLTGDYSYKIVTVFKDRNGLFHNAAISEESNLLSATADSIDLTVNNIQAGEGYDARGALANGTQSNSPSSGIVTLTVDNNTVIENDVIYLLNRDSGDYEEFTVTASTSTSISVTSSVDIDLTDNDVISTGIRHEIYRTKAGGTTYFLIGTIPNNYVSSTTTYNDDAVDSTLESRLIEPARVRGEPPKAKYITTYRNQLILGNQRTNPNTIFYSEPDEPTNFPVLNSFNVEASSGGSISGVSGSNEALVIFKKDPESTFTVTGDLVSARIRVDLLSSDIGCISHSSIQDLNGVLFFLSVKGIYSMIGAGIPQLRSRNVNKLLTNTSSAVVRLLQLKRGVASHNKENKEYVLFVPAEEENSNIKFANNNSLILVYNYFNDNWTTWTNVNMANGVVYHEGSLNWASRQENLTNSAVTSHIFRQHKEGIAGDFGDQTNAIPMRYGSGWESNERPSSYKKFLRVKIHSITRSDDDVTVEDFTISGSTELNFNYDTPHSNFSGNFPDRGVPWDTKPWDEFAWGGFQQTSFRTKLRSGKATSLRLILENEEYNKNVVITGWEIEISDSQRTTIKE